MTYVWEVRDEGRLGRGYPRAYRIFDTHTRFFETREAAEEFCAPIIEAIHVDFLKEMHSYVTDPAESECYSQEEIDWWLSSPAVAKTRMEDQTFYGVGDPEADSRDRCGAAYGWIVRRKIAS